MEIKKFSYWNSFIFCLMIISFWIINALILDPRIIMVFLCVPFFIAGLALFLFFMPPDPKIPEHIRESKTIISGLAEATIWASFGTKIGANICAPAAAMTAIGASVHASSISGPFMEFELHTGQFIGYALMTIFFTFFGSLFMFSRFYKSFIFQVLLPVFVFFSVYSGLQEWPVPATVLFIFGGILSPFIFKPLITRNKSGFKLAVV